MNVQLRLVERAGADVRTADVVALRRHLTAHPELRGRVSAVPSSPPEGEMSGSGMELLLVGLSSGGALTALVTALPALLKARQSAASVEITLADGRSAKVTADSADDARLLLEEAFDRLNPPQL
ncbi:hypothetical protein HW130_33290 [Streptomyces sp. PKU-EA00015]|uniref:effector-associated constant component EACC1 n=1 Tax=Streptomyces sp. PKU-EA00015 TaxID=2748326 RepID=UPI0015A47FAA|nr:hypothetical protein [Streptomyces sp. PKU-EA00015]NWF31063.1 hypothetical protein [Streptomyces sp. PKU-EA00015]